MELSWQKDAAREELFSGTAKTSTAIAWLQEFTWFKQQRARARRVQFVK